MCTDDRAPPPEGQICDRARRKSADDRGPAGTGYQALGNPPQGGSGTVTKTLLQNIEVLSAGQEFKKDVEGKPIAVGVINVLVTPQQAEILSLAANQTTIQLVLRNPLDTQVAKTTGAAMGQLLWALVSGPEFLTNH